MKMNKILILFIIILLLGCSKQSENCFIPFPEKLDSLDINPGIRYDYFEFRIGPNSERVFISRLNSDLDANIKDEMNLKFDSILVESGFSEFPHLRGFNYVLSQFKNETQVWNTSSELKTFLGEIDTETEAQIYIMSMGFPPILNDTTQTGVKRMNNKFIVRATRMDELCNPIITNRYTFSVDKIGHIDTLEIKMINKDEKGCI